jgi:hypothetical protein
VIQVLEVTGGRGERQLLGNQEIPRVAVGHVANLAAAADLADVVQQNDLHRLS